MEHGPYPRLLWQEYSDGETCPFSIYAVYETPFEPFWMGRNADEAIAQLCWARNCLLTPEEYVQLAEVMQAPQGMWPEKK